MNCDIKPCIFLLIFGYLLSFYIYLFLHLHDIGQKPNYLMVYRFNNQLKEGPYNSSRVQPSDLTKAEQYQSHLKVDDDNSFTTSTIHNDSCAKQYNLTNMNMLRFIKELSLSKSKWNLYYTIVKKTIRYNDDTDDTVDGETDDDAAGGGDDNDDGDDDDDGDDV